MQNSLTECVRVKVAFEDEVLDAIASRDQLEDSFPIVKVLHSGKRMCVPRSIITVVEVGDAS